MTEKLILEKLDKLEQHNTKMEVKVDKIENSVALIAVQTERINHISSEVQQLKHQYDTAFAPAGIVDQVSKWQASCPRDRINDSLNRQWLIILFMGILVTGTFAKALGAF